MVRLVPSALALCLAASPAAADSPASIDTLYEQGGYRLAPQWRPLGTTHEAAVFVHVDVKKTADGHLAVWRSRELPFAEYHEKEYRYLSIRERVVLDCAGLRIGATGRFYYADRFGAGAIVARVSNPLPEWTEVVPDSLDEQLVKSACAPKPHTSARKTNKPQPASPATSPR